MVNYLTLTLPNTPTASSYLSVLGGNEASEDKPSSSTFFFTEESDGSLMITVSTDHFNVKI